MKPTSDRSPVTYLVSLIVFIVVAVMFTGPIGNFPIGDDWQYGYPVKTWVENGEMEFKGVFAPNILLQVAWGYLFCNIAGGFDFTFLRISTLITAFVGLFYFYKILQLFKTDKNYSLLIIFILFFSPLYYYLSFTFFTDIPFVCLCIIALYFFIKCVLEKKEKYLLISCFWVVASFYIRQPGLLFFPVFSLFILWDHHYSKKAITIATSLVLLALTVYFSMEKLVKPGLFIDDNFVPVGGQFYTALIEQPVNTVLEWIKKGIKTFIYLGFFGLPFLPFLWKKIVSLKAIHKKTIISVLILNALLFLFLFFIEKTFPFGGNIMFNFGLGTELLADVYTLGVPNTPKMPEWFMLTVQLISQLSASFLFLFIFKEFRSISQGKKKIVVLLLLLNAVYLPVMSITSFFDRYLILTIVSFFMVLSFFSASVNFRRPVLKFIPAILLTTFSVLATADFMDWNRAKNKAFLFLQEKGVSVKEIDAGYEYNGLYNYHFPKEEKEGRSFWWVTDDRYMITFGPVEGYSTMASFPYIRCLFFQEDAILVLQRNE